MLISSRFAYRADETPDESETSIPVVSYQDESDTQDKSVNRRLLLVFTHNESLKKVGTDMLAREFRGINIYC